MAKSKATIKTSFGTLIFGQAFYGIHSTCKDCEKRTSTCHDTCEEYKAYIKQLRKIKKQEYEKMRRRNEYERTFK